MYLDKLEPNLPSPSASALESGDHISTDICFDARVDLGSRVGGC